ncbi:putative ZIP family zinc transporter [Aspergillus clavatus NRRL 1]|uniref:ZIP family zinc transporter, putative n=1 Tax=Aspergillus clavatus (strain ATCC 1007 / CBS 513.65 / DSM 816 / NCTC 3887 / NRRL 1 / QM 1276 / 107) TaxID=344612 RepID=A1C3T8_ASPCL|nr:ZIP family zinc transporter, putative [Aspergillus clavatus NRRL 1]EAW15078.1 ZIP family zinc transporter, putative [Aspergillus clavatus NRRL 1]
MALFLILVLSTLACSFPVLARRFPRLPIPRHFLFISRHFGTGVLIATAFVHLLPTAFISLTDPCLPRFWSESYRAMAGFVAMISVFVVVVVEMFFAMKGAGHVHGSEYDHLISSTARDSIESTSNNADYLRLDSHGAADDLRLGAIQSNSQTDIPQQKSGSLLRTSPEPKHGQGKNSPLYHEEDSPDLENSEPVHNYHSVRGVGDSNSRCHDSQPQDLAGQTPPKLPSQSPRRQLLQCLLLEAGILFHSIFIGMALSVATGTSFVVLLVAICFHQTFEGFALGSRIASLIPDLFSPSSMKPWLMSLAYGTTTPVGQAIGLVLHNLYDPASTAGLLMVGITNAISSGLLLFAGLVELLAEDFLSESSYATLRGRRRIEACVAVAGGALLMALVGAFA